MKKMSLRITREKRSAAMLFFLVAFWVVQLSPNSFAGAGDGSQEKSHLSSPDSGKDPERKAIPVAQKQDDPEIKAIKDVVLKTYAGWMSRNPENSAPYFRKAPGDLFFDIWPASSQGWDAYKNSSQRFLNTLNELKIKVKDMRVERHGYIAWVLAVCDAESTSKKGEKFQVTNRYTGILTKTKEGWKVAHEHWSVPTRAGGFENW